MFASVKIRIRQDLMVVEILKKHSHLTSFLIISLMKETYHSYKGYSDEFFM